MGHDHIISNEHLIKEIFKLDRKELVSSFLSKQFSFPLTVNSFIYFINFYWLKDKKIFALTPDVLKEDF